MAIEIFGDLVLTENILFKEDLVVKGIIKCKRNAKYDLIVNGSIIAKDIFVNKISASGDIKANNVNANIVYAANMYVNNAYTKTIVTNSIEARNTIQACDINTNRIQGRSVSCENLKLMGIPFIVQNFNLRKNTDLIKDVERKEEKTKIVN
jgi:hypothetical protein